MRSFIAAALILSAASVQARSLAVGLPETADFTTALNQRIDAATPAERTRFNNYQDKKFGRHHHPHGGRHGGRRHSRDESHDESLETRNEDDEGMMEDLLARDNLMDSVVGITERDAQPEIVSEPALGKRQALACNGVNARPLYSLWGPANCLTNTPSDKIDDPINGLQVGTINNWANGKIPPSLRGIFYMEGNPYASECFSTGTNYWNDSTNTLETPMWAPKTWSSDVGSGQLAAALQTGATFQTGCKVNAQGRLNCFSQQWNKARNTLSFANDYTADEVAPNQWTRGSDIKGFQISSNPVKYARYNYNMWRIVDENGKRTDAFTKRYLPNIGASVGTTGQFFVHLKATQEVPQRR